MERLKKFNLSLDDFSPHPRAGLDLKVIEWCNKIIEEYPDFKVNLFVPAAYCRLGEEPRHLYKYQEWVDKVNKLPLNNYRVNMHGVFHRRHWADYGGHKGRPVSNNDEFQYLNREQANDFIAQMFVEFYDSGLYFHGYDWDGMTFRPPGWKVSEDVVKLMSEKKYIIAGSEEYYNKVKHIKNLKWVSWNWDLTGPCTAEGDIVAFGHTSNWTNNYMDEKRYSLIMKTLEKEKFDFKFIEDMI
jgi:hypothetical protein